MPSTGSQAIGSNHRILIVDDNEAIHDDFRKILSFDPQEADLDAHAARLFGGVAEPARPQFELSFAAQGTEALELVRAAAQRDERYAMAFMDVRMPPGWDGLETTKKLWEIDPDLQVVICTAYSDKSWDEMAQTLPHPERLLILKKPFDGIEVLQLAHSITEKWSLLQSSRHNQDELERLVSLRTQELADFFENASVGLMQIGPDGAILRINRAQMDLLGCALADALGRPVSDFHADPEVVSAFMRRLLAGETVNDFETRLRCKDGTSKTVLIDANALWEHGRLVHARCFTRDITERRRLENQLLRIQRIESIGTLAGGIAHDLNNSLNPIVLGVELLRDKLPEEERANVLSMMNSSARRGQEIVRQILSFARGVEGDHTAVSIPLLIAEQERICRQTFYKMIEIRSRVQEGLWTVMGDPTQLHQVLMNLCVNARDAMPEGGALTIEASNVRLDEDTDRLHATQRAGPYVLITVSDTGRGIPPQVMERIFDPFFTTKEAGKGTGLGLSSAFGILQQHGGFIDAWSEEGSGARFSVYLPAIPALQPDQAPSGDPSLPCGNGELILVVDDEQPVLHTVKTTLEIHGYAVITARDGVEAMAAFAEHKDDIALVLTDISMPAMDGPATILAMQNMRPATRIIAMSGILERARIIRDQGASSVTFLQKPFTSDKLLSRLRDVLAAAP